jgi:hypothetical protein
MSPPESWNARGNIFTECLAHISYITRLPCISSFGSFDSPVFAATSQLFPSYSPSGLILARLRCGDWRTAPSLSACTRPAAGGHRPCEHSSQPIFSAAAEALKHCTTVAKPEHSRRVDPVQPRCARCGSSDIHSSRRRIRGGVVLRAILVCTTQPHPSTSRPPACTRPAPLRANNAATLLSPRSLCVPVPSHPRAITKPSQRNTRHAASLGDSERHNNRRARSGKSQSRGVWFPIQTPRVQSAPCQQSDGRRLSHRIRLAPRLSEDIASTDPTSGGRR